MQNRKIQADSPAKTGRYRRIAMQKQRDTGGPCKSRDILAGSHAKTGKNRRIAMQKQGDTGG